MRTRNYSFEAMQVNNFKTKLSNSEKLPLKMEEE
jgi:hypothetical protein